MYIVNTVKRVILYGNEFIHHKEQNYRLKNVPNARVSTDLLHEISHNYKKSYIAFYEGSTYPTHLLKFRGQLEIPVIFLYDEAQIIQNRPRTQIYYFYNWSKKMVKGSMAKIQRNYTFFAKYDHFSLIDNSITFNLLP